MTGIEVEVIPVTESDLGTRATAAFAAGDLPDVIYHTLQYALPWAEAGILDTDAATDVIETLAPTPSRRARWRWRRSTAAMPRCRWMAGRR
jgi:multiple sugar transport system substrate-binding protein